ncbi:Ms4527A family Cys-rich leader peptide [Mycolicibacterium tusciae]|uniref:Ms4527A family Cys-rich leader peptide n=1 Tax=Mycolicibacterium tusciae TaxID=75922 RepID=UPI003C6DEC22
MFEISTECRAQAHVGRRSRAGFAHRERKSGPVRAFVGNRGTIEHVTAARIYTHRVSLVARRHVDFKRVCSCCCLRSTLI